MTFIEGARELRERINELTAGYYWLNSAKYATTPNAKDKFKELATRVLPDEIVNRFLSER